MKNTENRKTQHACLRLDPEKRLCPRYDNVTIAKYRVADRDSMGLRVLDDFCEEHIM